MNDKKTITISVRIKPVVKSPLTRDKEKYTGDIMSTHLKEHLGLCVGFNVTRPSVI